MSQSCKTCISYCTTIPDCLESLGLVVSMPDTDVIITITDKFNNRHEWEATTESSGLAIIDLSEAPAVWLNPFAGQFNVIVKDAHDVNVPFTDGTNEYECVDFKVVSTTPKKIVHYIDPENKYPSYS